MGFSPMAGGLLTGNYRKGEKGRATDLKASIHHDDTNKNAHVLDAHIAIATGCQSREGMFHSVRRIRNINLCRPACSAVYKG